MAAVCLDTNVLIWGIKEEASPGQEAMIPKAKALLSQLDRQHIRGMVPAIVMGELLMRMPREEHPAFAAQITRRFMVSPFDTRSAVLFATLWQDVKVLQGQDPFAIQPTRDELKADCMIIAIALAQRAGRIYSDDPHFSRIAAGRIPVERVADIAIQIEMDIPPQ